MWAPIVLRVLPWLVVTVAALASPRPQGPTAGQPAAGFAMATPPFAGTFANVLDDRLELQGTGTKRRGRWVTLGTDVAVQGTIQGDRFDGEAGGQPCHAQFRGDVLHFTIGNDSWRLRPRLPLDKSLADLGEPVVDPARQWTIAVYLAGDNDLERHAVADLLEMQQGLPATGVELCVLFDRAKGFAVQANGDWTETKLLHVRPGPQPKFLNLGEGKERDTGDPTTLASFVAGVFRKFPAPNHAVILWDHGGGWTGICSDFDAPGAKGGRSLLSLAGIRSGLQSALLHSGVLRLDLLGFDACMMAQLEVALAVTDLATTMVASEAVVPGSGYPYDLLLPTFAATTDPAVLGKALVAAYGGFSEAIHKSTATMHALDLRRLPAVAAAFETIARQALLASKDHWAAIARALFYAENYEVRADREADAAVGSIDLLDLAARLRGIPGIDGTAIDALASAVDAARLAHHGGAERTLSHGLAIYGPHRAGQYDTNYRTTPLGNGSSWPTLLELVHARAAADQSPLVVADFRVLNAVEQPTTKVRPFGGDRLRFTATGNSIVEVQQHDLQWDTGAETWLLLRRQLVTDPYWPQRWDRAAAADMIDLVMPEYRDGKNDLYAELSGMTFAIGNGERNAYATLDLSAPSMQAPLTVVARYQPADGGKAQLVQIAFDRAWWRAVSVRPIAKNGTVLGRLIEPEAKDQFSFRLETFDDRGPTEPIFTEPLVWGAQGLHLVPEAEEAGRYRVAMVARTIHGRTARAHTDYVVEDNPDLAAWPKSWEGFDPSTMPGTWTQHLVVGPQTYRDLKTTATVTPDPLGNHVFRVVQVGGPNGNDFETHPRWVFEWSGLPCLRIVTEIADGQTLCWYGPARIERRHGKLVLVQKALSAGGVVWEWRQQ